MQIKLTDEQKAQLEKRASVIVSPECNFYEAILALLAFAGLADTFKLSSKYLNKFLCFASKNRSAAVVSFGRFMKKLWITVSAPNFRLLKEV